MKAIVCEMCGSTDFVKSDNLYVCNHCGTKYTVEEARKMMIEGTVDVAGTVKVDNSAFVEKFLANARRAKAKEDWEETEKYYNLVEQNDPQNIEAIFYSAYGKAKTTLVDSDLYKRQAAFNVLQKSVSVLDDNFDLTKESEQKEIITQISKDILAICGSSYVFNQRKNGYGIVVWTDKNETLVLFRNLKNEFITTIENIIAKYGEENKGRTDYLYQILLSVYTHFLLSASAYDKQNIWGPKINALHVRWNAAIPSHEAPPSLDFTEDVKKAKKRTKGIIIGIVVGVVVLGVLIGVIVGLLS